METVSLPAGCIVFYICICKSLANGFKTWNQLAARYIAIQTDLIPRPGPSSKVRDLDEWTIKTPNPICRLFFKIYLLTEFAVLCLTDFIDWRYIHSLIGIFDPACELLPPWMKELYSCIVAPLSSPWPHPPPPSPSQTKCTVYTDGGVWGGGGWIVPYPAGILHSVSDKIQTLPNCFTTANKMTSEDDSKELVSLKFLRPWSERWRLKPFLIHQRALLSWQCSDIINSKLSWVNNYTWISWQLHSCFLWRYWLFKKCKRLVATCHSFWFIVFCCTWYRNRRNTLLLHGCCRLETTGSRVEKRACRLSVVGIRGF